MSSYANGLLKNHGVTQLPVCPFTIAEREGIRCQPMASSTGGVSGVLLKCGEAYGILYGTHIDNEPFQRFSVAHELGHMFLPDHADKLTAQGPHMSKAGFETDLTLEREADLFAANLLMPSFLFDRALDQRATDLSAVKSLSGLCVTSLTATAIQVVQRTSEVAAMVMSTGTTIDYAFLSESLKEYPNIQRPKKGHPLPRGSLAVRVYGSAGTVAQQAEEIGDFQNWFGGPIQGEILEEVIHLGTYGRTLTFLTASDLPSPEEFEEDESVAESWTPRFKR